MTLPDSLPNVAIIGTGGTIAGTKAAAHGQAYAAGVLSVDALLAAVPGLDQVAWITAEQMFSVDSVDMTTRRLVSLARRVDELCARDDVDAVVITHGTDTLEESSFLVNLTVRTQKPIVLTGSMRPADALSADGPGNLYDAVTVAASAAARGTGALVVMNGEIHSARDVSKTNTTRTDTFESDHGHLGIVSDGVVRIARHLASRHTHTSAFDIRDIPEGDRLPPVGVVVTRPGIPGTVIQAMVDSGVRGIVHAGPGNGNVASTVLDKLDEARAAGVVVVRAARVGAGMVTRNGAVDDDTHDFVAADDHNPYKSRLLLALALHRTADTAQIQRWFYEH